MKEPGFWRQTSGVLSNLNVFSSLLPLSEVVAVTGGDLLREIYSDPPCVWHRLICCRSAAN